LTNGPRLTDLILYQLCGILSSIIIKFAQLFDHLLLRCSYLRNKGIDVIIVYAK